MPNQPEQTGEELEELDALAYRVKRRLMGGLVVEYACHNCGKELENDLHEMAGKLDACPFCGADHTVPGVPELESQRLQQAALQAERRLAAERRQDIETPPTPANAATNTQPTAEKPPVTKESRAFRNAMIACACIGILLVGIAVYQSRTEIFSQGPERDTSSDNQAVSPPVLPAEPRYGRYRDSLLRLKDELNNMRAMRQVGGNYIEHKEQIRQLVAARNLVAELPESFSSGRLVLYHTDDAISNYESAMQSWERSIRTDRLSSQLSYEKMRDDAFERADKALNSATTFSSGLERDLSE